jgi:hypothetical protein
MVDSSDDSHPLSRGPKDRLTRGPYKIRISNYHDQVFPTTIAPFGDAYEKIGTIQRRLAWPLHKDDTLFQSGRPTGLNIYFSSIFLWYHDLLL